MRARWWTLVVVIALAGAGAFAYIHWHHGSQISAIMRDGVRAEKRGALNLAAQDFYKVIADNPSNQLHLTTYALYNLGVIYTTRNDDPVAIGYYDQSIATDDRYLPALFNVAVLETATNPTAALREYNRILAIKPKDTYTLFNVGLLNDQLGHVAIAKIEVAQAIRQDPSLKTRLPASFGGL